MYSFKNALKLLALTTALVAPALISAQSADTNPSAAADAEYHANWGLDMINALPAYLKGFTGKDIVVGVIDTGLDINHPEYAGRISPFLFNYGIDQDTDNVFPSIDEDDGSISGHGDHVAGIIGAGRNGFGMHGVAYNSILMPLRAIDAGETRGNQAAVNQAIVYATNHGAKVINGSYGPYAFPMPIDDDNNPNPNYEVLNYQLILNSPEGLRKTYDALKYAADNDVVMVFAAGNERRVQPGAFSTIPSGNGMLPLITRDFINSGRIRFLNTRDNNIDLNNPDTYSFINPSDPAFDNMDFSDLQGSLITVVSLGPDGKLASYSNECGEAAEWCIAAPGGSMYVDAKDGIYSTWPQGDPTNGNRTYKYLQGTSMASPHVAGAAAVVRSAFPYMNARQTIETILTTTTKNGFEDQNKFGQGLLNLGAAVDGPMAFRYSGVFDVDTQGYSSIWSNPISGAGDLTKRGDGILALAGHNTYQGPTNILGGTLEVNGSITSETHVSQTGQLTGTGAVSDLTLAQGGKVSPGSALFTDQAIGTLTVNGSFIQQSGSAYVADLAFGTGTDQIIVNGTAQLDNNASVELVHRGKAHGSATARYTLLTASSGVTGTYGNLSNNFAAQLPFINFALNYDANNVFLDTSRSDIAFADFAVTHNQTATATALESQGEGGNLYDRMLFLNETEARQAYDQMSGEAYASIQSALVNNSAYTRMAVYEQLSQGFAKPSASSETSTKIPDQPNVWAHSFGDWTQYSGGINVAQMKTDIAGFLTGVDVQAFNNWRFGVLAGYSHTNFRLNEHMSSGSSADYTIGAYGRTETALGQGTLALRSGLAYTWHNIDMTRSVAFADFSDKLSADYRAGTFQLFGELGYKHQATEKFAIEPYANLAYVHLGTNAFTEKDRHGAALTVHKNTMDTALSSLGFRVTADLNQEVIPVKARADIAWRHAFGDVTPISEANFAGSNSFTVNGSDIGRNTVLLSGGLDFQLKHNAVLGIAYQGQFGSGITQNGLNTHLKIKF